MKHKHIWQLDETWGREYGLKMATFVCECGVIKRVELKEELKCQP